MRIPTPRGKILISFFAFASIFIIYTALSFFSSRNKNPSPVEQAAKTIKPVENVMDTKSITNSLPKLGGPPGYVSSAACKECHVQQYDSWWRSYHRQMTQVMSPTAVKADFNNVTMDSGPARFTLHQSTNHYWVDIESIAEIESAQRTNGLPPEPLQLPVGMVTGSHYFQVFWTPTGHGNHQVGFPLTWLIAEKHWVPRNDAFIRDPDFTPSPEQWNRVCIRCHTTGSKPARCVMRRNKSCMTRM